MKKIMSAILGALFVTIIFTSCKHDNNKIGSAIEEIVGREILGAKMVLIIPKLGCSSCFVTAIDFVTQHNDTSNLIVIAVGFKSMKELRLEFGKNVVQASNFFWDKEKRLFQNGMISNNPRVLFFEEGEMMASKLISVENNSKVVLEMELFLNNLR